MINFILGFVFGAGAFWLYSLSKSAKIVAWFAWALFAIGAISFAFGFDIFFGSMIEHEMQAGWMGLGICILLTIVTFIAGWRYGVVDRIASVKE